MTWKEEAPARGVLKDTLRRGPVSLDEIGRRLGHTRGYMSRALRGVNLLTIDTITGALEVAGIRLSLPPVRPSLPPVRPSLPLASLA